MTTDLREKLQTTLGDSYVLEQELSGGGMSRVFVATDTSLHRKVVVKVLPSELAAEVRIDRFRREIDLAAQLQHPHIVPLLVAGETNGLPYFIMPFVKGKSLREQLEKAGELPILEVVRTLREVASALAYAHENGIVHRDIKPENVLISGGSAVVTDFGVAKALTSASIGGGKGLTSTGVAIGTPAYMAPEQGTADPATDYRADIYALGVMGYEMLAGSPPFSARSSQEMVAAHVTRRPEPITDRRPTVPPILGALIMKCLEKHSSDRPQSALEVIQQLDCIHTSNSAHEAYAHSEQVAKKVVAEGGGARSLENRRSFGHNAAWSLAGAVSLIVLLLFAAWRFAPWHNPESADGVGRSKMLAVLPFENIGPSENAYFSDGMTEEVRGKLASLSGLMVIARSSSAQYKQTQKSAAQIARELGVEYLLAATIRTEPGVGGKRAHVRVSPELIQVVNGAPITRWQQGFDADVTDVLTVQSDIAQRVAQSLDIQLGAADRSQLVSRPTENLAAYDAFLHGEEASNGVSASDAPSLQRAIRFYEEAVRLDSTFSQALAHLSRARGYLYYNTLAQNGISLIESVLRPAEKSVALAPDRPEGRLALALFYVYGATDIPKAEEQLHLVLAHTPNNAEALRLSAAVARTGGRWKESLAFARRSQALDPRSLGAALLLGRTLLAMRQYADARQPLDLAVALSSGDLGALAIRAELELAQGNLAGARQVIAAGKKSGSEAELVAFFGQIDLTWVLTDAEQRLLLTLSPKPFGDDRALWGSALAQLYSFRGNEAMSRAFADSANTALEAALLSAPDRPDLHAARGIALARLKRFAEAEQAGERAATLLPVSRDAETGPSMQHYLAIVYILTGKHEKALDHLEALLRIPYDQLSPGRLRIDPTFAPLRGNPRFDRLAAQEPVRSP